MSDIEQQTSSLSKEDRDKLLQAMMQSSATITIDSFDGPVEILQTEYAEMMKKVGDNDGEFVLKLLPFFWPLLDYVPMSLKKDKLFMMGAVNISVSHVQNLGHRCEDVDVALYVLKNMNSKGWSTGNTLTSFSRSLLEDEKVSKILAKKFPMFINISPKLCNNVKLVQLAISNNGRAIQYASKELLRENKHLILKAVKNSRKSLYYVLNYIDSSFAKNPILSEAAFNNFRKRITCHTIPVEKEIEMRKIFRGEYVRAIQTIGDSYKDPILHSKYGEPIPQEELDYEWIMFCKEEEERLESLFLYCHTDFFGKLSDVSLITIE